MKSLSIVGLGLGVAFGCLLILLVAEICYFLCWKKKSTSQTDSEKGINNVSGKHLFQMFSEERAGFNNGDDDDPEGQVQPHTWRYSQSPRFLFTIEEGMKEGSECESVNKSSCRVSPCDSFIVETPYFTPLASASPCLASPIILPLTLNHHLESAKNDAAELNRVMKASTPPSRFKLLHHTQEKKPS